VNGSNQEVVLVSGFPRLIARRVADALLAEKTERVVRLLVRPKFRDDAEAFVRASPNGTRIELLDGDAAAIDLGLSGVEFKQLAGEVDYIQHLAQISYEGADPKAAYDLNVQGAREVLELARAAKGLKRLVHLSSTRVSGDRTGVVQEEDLEAGQSFHSPIAETMYRAERLMRRAMDTVPVTILRPSIMVGDSRTGEIDRLDGPYLLVLLVLTSPAEITLPLPARGDAPLHLVPIDYVARAAAAMMCEPGAASRTFHLVDPSPLSARSVYERVARIAGRKLPRGFIPVNFTRALLRAPGLERFVKSPRAFVDQLATPVTYASHGAREVLQPRAIECPPLDSYLDALVNYVRERLAAKKAQRMEEVASEIEDPLA
jgi:nucleoside-diphosphate-sugar epimerase